MSSTSRRYLAGLCLLSLLGLAGLSLTTQANRSQPPKLPLEILLRIIDEVDSDVPQRAGTLKALSQTCHALALYCRPLVFRTIVLHPKNLVPFLNWQNTASPSTAMQLCGLIRHLLIIVQPVPQLSPYHRVPANNAWLRLFDLKQPTLFTQLESLKLTYPSFDIIPDQIFSTMFRWLPIQATETLTLETTGHISNQILGLIPSGVTDLTLVGTELSFKGRGIPVPNSEFAAYEAFKASKPRPILQRLSINCTQRSTQYPIASAKNLFSDADVSNLRHLQFESLFVMDHDGVFFGQVLQRLGTHLQCLHLRIIPPGLLLSRVRPVDIASLSHLRCLEVSHSYEEEGGEDEEKRNLIVTLTWFNKLLENPEILAKQLKFSILITECDFGEERLLRLRALWDGICTTPFPSSLKQAHVVAYASSAGGFDPQSGELKEVVLVGTTDGEGETPDYHSLWEGCSCTGWRVF